MSKYKHIVKCDKPLPRWASIEDDLGNIIVDVTIDDSDVVIASSAHGDTMRTMPKADAIAALEEMIDYIRSEGK